MLRILFLVLPPHKKYFIFVISILKGEIIYLPKWHGASLQNVMGKLKNNTVCESQRADHPMWQKRELLNLKSGDQRPLQKKRGVFWKARWVGEKIKIKKMKKIIMVFIGLLFAATIFSSCGGKSKSSGNSNVKETHTCATCGASFDWSCTTDVFGKCVCSEGCSGRWYFNKKVETRIHSNKRGEIRKAIWVGKNLNFIKWKK